MRSNLPLIAVADLHGRNDWQKINPENYRKIIFLGDYFDSKEDEIYLNEIGNFLHLQDFRNENPEKVVLLCGNHDLHYLEGVSEHSSGFQEILQVVFGEVLQPLLNEKILKICHYDRETDTMFSHAGISRNWFKQIISDYGEFEESLLFQPEKIEYLLNEMFWKFPEIFQYQKYENLKSPCWIRPAELLSAIMPFRQVVGHTPFPEATQMKNVYFCETEGSDTGFLEI